MNKRNKKSAIASAQSLDAPLPDSFTYTARSPESDDLLTLILRGGEALAAPHCRNPKHPKAHQAQPEGDRAATVPDNYDGLLRVIEQIRALLAEEPRLAEHLANLPAAFGNGEALRALFVNLFPVQKTSPVLDDDGKPILSDREIEVLQHLSDDRTQEEVAAVLGIEKLTVRKHLSNIYAKLGVHKPMKAVARAAALGYLDWGAINFPLMNVRQYLTLGSPFPTFCGSIDSIHPALDRTDMRCLAEFGLLLLALSGAVARQVDGDAPTRPRAPGGICELDAQGKTVRVFGEYLDIVRSIIIAPPHAARQGFTPGHLFVSYDLVPQQGLNRGAIAEFTPEGQLVRAFTGGSEIGTRMIGHLSLAFVADGRLLVSCGWLTNAILAFAAGGGKVSRFIEGGFNQIYVGPQDVLAGAQSFTVGSAIRLFAPDGQPLPARGARFHPTSGTWCHSVAVNLDNHAFIGRTEGERHLIEEYDAEGAFVRDLLIPGYTGSRLTVDAQNCLYVPCSQSGDLKILSPDGEILRCIPLEKMKDPTGVAVREDGRMWVCGIMP